MQDFQTLMQEHDHLDMLSLRLIDAVGAKADIATLLDNRARLSVVLEDHLSREDAFLYERLLKQSSDDFPTTLSAFHRNFADLAADWADYLRDWDADCIAADRDAFDHETVTIIDRLRARIAEENRLLYPMALIKGHIRLRAA